MTKDITSLVQIGSFCAFQKLYIFLQQLAPTEIRWKSTIKTSYIQKYISHISDALVKWHEVNHIYISYVLVID